MTRETVSANQDEVKLIDDRIIAFNNSKIPSMQGLEPLSINYVKEDEKIIAGINAVIYPGGVLYMDVLFVDEEYRGQDLGTHLLNKVEMQAKEIGATLVHLATFDFQAKDFYLKMGYKVFGVLENSPKGHKCYYLKKDL